MDSTSFCASPTLVGSLPHPEPERITDRLLEMFPEMPAWAQFPCRDFRESMYVQYSEGLPGAVVDREAQRIFFSTGGRFRDELEAFYQAVVGEDVDHFAIGRDHAVGLHLLLERLRDGARRPWAKGQVTGPFSFAMTVTDEAKRSLAYDPELFEVAVQGMAGKARWSARRLREIADGVLVVLDEPYLCSFGSAFVNVARPDVVTAIRTSVDAIHAEGALAGLHCCGNTDWSLALETGIDVLNLDAFEFFQGLPLYPAELGAFVERGGVLSLGIVPTSEAALAQSAESLLGALIERIALLAAKGLDRQRLFRQSLLTPACGLGTKPVALADRVLTLLADVSRRLRERGGF